MKSNKNTVGESNTNLYIYNKDSSVKAQVTLKKRWWKDYKKIREFDMRLCLLVVSKALLIMSQQLDHPNMNWTRITAQMYISKWKEKSPWVFYPTQKTTGT